MLLVPILDPPGKGPLPDELPAAKRTVHVASVDGLVAALGTATAGDHITLKDGYYDFISPIRGSAVGTASDPIVIQAETDGGVELGGSYGFSLNNAAYVVIKGFKFTHDPGISSVAFSCSDCVGVRITANTFTLSNENNKSSHWLGILGKSSDVRVDHNTFGYKTTEGAFLIVVGEDDVIPQRTLIDHNMFRDQQYGGGDGGECMIIGHSSQGRVRANTIVEYNTFERCNGDAEVISVKSTGNVFRYNTFRDNAGSLVFRHGSGQVAEGNKFLDGQNGIRVYGADHRIINNYFENIPTGGTSSSYALVIPGGTVAEDGTVANAGYAQPRNVLVAHNTFVNNAVSIVIGSSSSEEFKPVDIIVANNIVTGSSGKLVQVNNGEISFSNNLVYAEGSAILGNIPESGYVSLDPLLERAEGIYVPSGASPAIDAVRAADSFGISKDILGNPRTGLYDLGAYESQ